MKAYPNDYGLHNGTMQQRIRCNRVIFGTDVRRLKVTRLIACQAYTLLTRRADDLADLSKPVNISREVVWDREEIGFEMFDVAAAFVGLVRIGWWLAFDSGPEQSSCHSRKS